jgi:RimJ/RimL family protein N-acetyltransferase
MASALLRPLQPGDLDRIHRWHNSQELYQSLVGECHSPALETVRDWLAEKCRPNPREVSFAICRSSDSLHIGNIYLKQIDTVRGDAELHMFIGDADQRGHGFGAAAIELILQYATVELGLRRIYLRVLQENVAAVRLYLRCGFSVNHDGREADESPGVLRMTKDLGSCSG